MPSAAINFALETLSPPPGRRLSLYADAGGEGDVYSPWHMPSHPTARFISRLEEMDDSYAAVFATLPKQRQEAQGLLALAFAKSRGFVIATAANDAGGKRLAQDMEQYGVPLHQISKHRERAVWSFDASRADKEVVRTQLANLALRQMDMEGELWWSVPGLFAWDRIDPASRLLLEHLPDDMVGLIADFGCGYGYLSASLARRYPAISRIDAYDADARAVKCCRRNGGAKIQTQWQDVARLEVASAYDAVVMNPPFHIGKVQHAGLGQLFIAKAWQSLKPGGRLFCVANRHLPYEKTIGGLRLSYEGQSYKIITGCKP